MKYKSILLFVFLVAVIASFNFISCHKYENDDYSDWREVTAADSVIFAKARTAYIDDPENVTDPGYETLKSIEFKPFSVRTKVVENGMNYQFSFPMIVVTIFKSDSDDIGKVTDIEENPSKPGWPSRRDTITE